MNRDPWGLEALTRRIAAVDPTGPVPEATAELTRLHRELTDALGPEQARVRFDEALQCALSPTGPVGGLRPSTPVQIAAA